MRYAVFIGALVASAGVAVAGPLSLSFLSRGSSGLYNGSAAEVPAFDPVTKRVFVVNGAIGQVDVFQMSGSGALTPAGSIPVPGVTGAGKLNSVAIRNGVLAVAANNNASNQGNGSVHFFNTASTAHLGSTSVGALPDMLTFTPDGSKLLVANEAEPNSYGQADSVDPEGSVSIVDVSFPSTGNVTIGSTSTAGFGGFNGQAAALRAAGVRIFGTNATVAQDLEPEYITVSADSTKAYVTLQEANAMATIDIATGTVTDIRSFGLKDHSTPGNGMDPSDRDGPGGTAAVNIREVPVHGIYQPDAIASFVKDGQTYLITANEGDARDYVGLSEEVRVGSSSYVLDPTAFPNASVLKNNANLGRLTVSNQTGDTDNDGDFDRIEVFGSRSFSIWTPTLTQVFDSGDDIEQLTASLYPNNFNSNSTSNSLDDRSDNKGPEPEGVTIGEVNGRTLAFICLERVGGIMMYDVSNPAMPVFLDYINTRNFSVSPSQANLPLVGDLGPEALVFVSAADSPTGLPLLIVGNEISGTTSVYTIVPAPGAAALLGLAGVFASRRRR
ncbi:MAG: choice-of-anchor I family protein [Planctomycetota bacterium]|nr:choice-of-anchor I family protein [Planctomycetota bacterium]